MIKGLKKRTELFIAIGFATGVLEGMLFMLNLQENQKQAIQEAIDKLNKIKDL